jgi:DNA helicase-2/ATP-dependent DNA helicase PcrA
VQWEPCSDDHDELTRIATLLTSMQGRFGTWNVLAVLVRTNALVETVARHLDGHGIPVRSSRRGPDWSAAVASAVSLTGREAMSVWSSDILDDGDHDGPAEFAEVAGLVRAYLDEHRGRSVDGRSFGSWLATAVDRSDVTGVEVMTFHAAKGRQWRGVVVAGAEDGLLPHSSARTRVQKAEEARLAYVAFTRAADELAVTWAGERSGRSRKRSPLLPVAATVVTSPQDPGDDVRAIRSRASTPHPVAVELVKWRNDIARRTRLEAAGVLSDRQIELIIAEQPTSVAQLAAITDRAFAGRHGTAILAIVNPAD